MHPSEATNEKLTNFLLKYMTGQTLDSKKHSIFSTEILGIEKEILTSTDFYSENF